MKPTSRLSLADQSTNQSTTYTNHWKSRQHVRVVRLGRLRKTLSLEEGRVAWVLRGPLCATPAQAAACHDVGQIFLELQVRSFVPPLPLTGCLFSLLCLTGCAAPPRAAFVLAAAWRAA